MPPREIIDRYCILDTETTGKIAGFHDAIEIAILVLDEYMDVDKKIRPFHIYMLPSRPDNIDIEALKVQKSPNDGETLTREKLKEVLRHGLTPLKASEIFMDWLDDIRLAPKGRLLPIGHNWPFDRGFIKDWLGDLSFEYAFSHLFIDTIAVAKFIEGVMLAKGRSSPFGLSMRLSDVARDLDYFPERSHNALDDCITTAHVLKRLHTFIL